MKILVSGGCGFVGKHLIARLGQEPGNEIWVVDDLSTGIHPAKWENSELAKKIKFIQADFLSLMLSELGRQPDLGFPRLPQFDEIYHLAAVVGGRPVMDGDPLRVGIDLGIDSVFFLWAAKINMPGRILYASSSAAYPASKQDYQNPKRLEENDIDFESGVLQPDYAYGWGKLTGEYLARIAVRKYKLKVAVVRPFSGYGGDQEPCYPVPAIALRVAARRNPLKIWGNGQQGRDFIYIDDCIEACVLACRKIGDATPVNIGSGVLTCFKELAEMMIRIEGYSAKVQGMEDKPIGTPRRFCDTRRMQEILQWKPSVSLAEGLKRVLDVAHKRLESGIKPED